MKKTLSFIVLGVFILLGIAYLYLGYIDFEKEGWFIDDENVRGSSVTHDHLNYTLNFDEQSTLVKELNRSKKVKKSTLSKTKSPVSSIVIYRFNDLKPIVLTPNSENYSLFSVSIWNENEYLKIQEPNGIQQLLAATYDP